MSKKLTIEQRERIMFNSEFDEVVRDLVDAYDNLTEQQREACADHVGALVEFCAELVTTCEPDPDRERDEMIDRQEDDEHAG